MNHLLVSIFLSTISIIISNISIVPKNTPKHNFRSSFLNVPAHTKTQSLPNHHTSSSSHSSVRDYNCRILSFLRVTPEEFSSQLTLLDLPSFLSIQPDELTSCAWNKKNKLVVAPNVVTFTRRFNHVRKFSFVIARGAPGFCLRTCVVSGCF